MYYSIISIENLLLSWKEFLKGKRKRKDVMEFSVKLFDNIIELHRELELKTYRHGGYQAFKINDPKPRDIHKASVRDRLIHHAIYRILYPYFDKKFIFDSYSCRLGKGTHKATSRFRYFYHKVSKNNTKTCWVLKCDIRKFFASIDHETLRSILKKHINNNNALWLLGQIIESFNTEGKVGIGLPLGNLTSQLFVNVYMNEFDQFIKREVKTQYYLRYADDFVILDTDKMRLEKLIFDIRKFLNSELRLALHAEKIFIKTIVSGVDLLGWNHFFHYRTLRTATKRRMLRRIDGKPSKETIASYLGLLLHGNTYKIAKKLFFGSNGADLILLVFTIFLNYN